MSKKIAIVFFGTDSLAETILTGLVNSPLFSVELVITQPDRPVGRKKEMQQPPVKTLALAHGIPIDQPASLKKYNLPNTNATIAVLAEYGNMIPQHIIDVFPLGIINVHPSFLPKYRGATPVQSALMHGETETGLTIMKLDAGMDTGPILAQKSYPIDRADTYETLFPKLAALGSALLIETLPKYVSGNVKPKEQDDANATVCRMLSRDDGRVDWKQSAEHMYNQWRGLTPWPGIWTTWNNTRMKLHRIAVANKQLPRGQILVDHDTMFVGCGTDAIQILELQLEGKPKTTAAAFIAGHRQMDGIKLKIL